MEAATSFLGVDQSLKGRKWRLRDGEPRIAAAIAQQLGEPEIIGRILAGRGIGVDTAEAYLNPNLRADMPDPNILVDMDRDFQGFNDVYRERIGHVGPTRTTVAIRALPTPIAVEFKAIAWLGSR